MMWFIQCNGWEDYGKRQRVYPFAYGFLHGMFGPRLVDILLYFFVTTWTYPNLICKQP